MSLAYGREDYVKIVNEFSPYHGLVGRVVNIIGEDIVIDVFGDVVSVVSEDIELRAKYMSHAYYECSTKFKNWHTRRLLNEDIKELIDLALDMKDLAWATELSKRLKVN